MNDQYASLPPPHLLNALREPRRPQLSDPQVLELLAEWKMLGRPIEYDDLNQIVDIVSPGIAPTARIRAKIVAAVESAGIAINNFDSMRKWTAEENVNVSLTCRAAFQLMEEARWRWPVNWDNRSPFS